MPISFFHLLSLVGNFEFDSLPNDIEYETETKNELKEMFHEVGDYLAKLQEAGIEIRQLFDLFADNIVVETSAGTWRVRAYLRLTNFSKMFNTLAVPSSVS